MVSCVVLANGHGAGMLSAIGLGVFIRGPAHKSAVCVEDDVLDVFS